MSFLVQNTQHSNFLISNTLLSKVKSIKSTVSTEADINLAGSTTAGGVLGIVLVVWMELFHGGYSPQPLPPCVYSILNCMYTYRCRNWGRGEGGGGNILGY